MKTLLATLLLALGFSAQAADETYLTVPLTSYHLSSKFEPGTHKPYNDRNVGIGFGQRWSTDNGYQLGYTIGTYRNSYYTQSNYAAFEASKRVNDYLRFGLLLGGVTGYGGNNLAKSGIGPMVVPQVEVSLGGKSSLTASYLQTTIPGGSSAIALSFNQEF